MESVKLMLSEKKSEQFSGDLLVYCIEQARKGVLKCASSAVQGWLEQIGPLGEFSAKSGESLLLYPQVEKNNEFSAKRVLVLGLGKIEEKDNRDELREKCRLAGGVIAQQAGKTKAKKIMICLPEVMGIRPREVAECLSEGVLLGDYRFLKYKRNEKKPEDKGENGEET